VSAVFGTLALVLPSREAKLLAMLILGLVLLGTVGGMAIRGKRPGARDAHEHPGATLVQRGDRAT
jgi:hypothetical protein